MYWFGYRWYVNVQYVFVARVESATKISLMELSCLPRYAPLALQLAFFN